MHKILDPSALRPCWQVGLAGPSGSGKTAFSEKVRSFIPGITVLSMDNYTDASRLIDGNFDGALRLHPTLPITQRLPYADYARFCITEHRPCWQCCLTSTAQR